MKLLSWVSKHHDPLSTVPEGEVRLAKTSALFFPLLKCPSSLHLTSNLCEPLFLQKWLLKSPYLTNPISQLQPITFSLFTCLSFFGKNLTFNRMIIYVLFWLFTRIYNFYDTSLPHFSGLSARHSISSFWSESVCQGYFFCIPEQIPSKLWWECQWRRQQANAFLLNYPTSWKMLAKPMEALPSIFLSAPSTGLSFLCMFLFCCIMLCSFTMLKWWLGIFLVFLENFVLVVIRMNT